MTATIITLSLSLALSSTGQEKPVGHCHCADPIPGQGHVHSFGHKHGDGTAGRIVPPGPGYGWGFPNGQPDHYGWVDYGTDLPLGADRTAEYYFPRFIAAPPEQMFMQSYYNPYVTRGQRYITYAGAGGDHPAGGPPIASAALARSPFGTMTYDKPVVNVPRLNGRVEAEPINSGGSGLTP